MKPVDSAGPSQIDVDRHLEIENTFEEIILLVSRARDEQRLPGIGPDSEEDLVAVLVSSGFKEDLQRPFYGFGDPLWNDAQQLEVPVVELPGLEQEFSPLRRGAAERLFGSLADESLSGRELEIGENVLEKIRSVDPPPVVSPELLMALARRGSTDGMKREDLPAA